MIGRILFALLVCALSAAAAFAQAPGANTRSDSPTFPEGLEGERFHMLIEALNTRDLGLAERFYDEHLAEEFRESFPVGSYLEGYQWIASTTGGLDFHGVRTYDPPRPDQTTVICRGRNYGSWWAIVFHYGEDRPAGITDMGITRARMPSDVAATTLSGGELAQELGDMMKRICGEGLFSGTVLVASGNDVVFQHACGEASKRLQASIDMDAEFDIGSMSTMFTAVAIAQLVEQGALSYDDPLSKFLDGSWLPAEIAERVTIHHLLTHTAGLGDFLNASLEEGSEGSRKRLHTVDDYRELVVGDTLAFEPGTDWSYSNTGMLLLAAVIENVTDGDYYEYLLENIYGPAGMESTDGDGGGPTDGVFSTAPDLLRFTQALASSALVSGETLARMWTDYREGEGGYGYGFMLRESQAGLAIGHDGGSGGSEAYYDIYIESGHTVVVMANLDGAAWPVAASIRDLMGRLE